MIPDANQHSRNDFARVLVAGSNGFIGKALCRYLFTQGLSVSGLDRMIGHRDDSSWQIDLLNEAEVNRVLRQVMPNVVFHSVGVVGSDDEDQLHLAHVETTRILLQSVHKECSSARVVVLGSAAEYGHSTMSSGQVTEDSPPHPVSAYGKSKLIQSELARHLASELSLDVVCVRLFNILGPGQTPQLVGGAMVNRLWMAIQDHLKYLDVYDPDSERDFLDVRDVARLLWRVATQLERNQARPPIHIASGEPTTVSELARTLLTAANVNTSVELRLINRPSRTSMIGQPLTLKRLLESTPVRQISLVDSLRDMWEWIIQHNERR